MTHLWEWERTSSLFCVGEWDGNRQRRRRRKKEKKKHTHTQGKWSWAGWVQVCRSSGLIRMFRHTWTCGAEPMTDWNQRDFPWMNILWWHCNRSRAACERGRFDLSHRGDYWKPVETHVGIISKERGHFAQKKREAFKLTPRMSQKATSAWLWSKHVCIYRKVLLNPLIFSRQVSFSTLHMSQSANLPTTEYLMALQTMWPPPSCCLPPPPPCPADTDPYFTSPTQLVLTLKHHSWWNLCISPENKLISLVWLAHLKVTQRCSHTQCWCPSISQTSLPADHTVVAWSPWAGSSCKAMGLDSATHRLRRDAYLKGNGAQTAEKDI